MVPNWVWWLGMLAPWMGALRRSPCSETWSVFPPGLTREERSLWVSPENSCWLQCPQQRCWCHYASRRFRVGLFHLIWASVTDSPICSPWYGFSISFVFLAHLPSERDCPQFLWLSERLPHWLSSSTGEVGEGHKQGCWLKRASLFHDDCPHGSVYVSEYWKLLPLYYVAARVLGMT